MSFLTAVESSGLHTADPDALEHAARGWLGHDLLIHTETTDAAERAIRRAGWSHTYRVKEILLGWNPEHIHVTDHAPLTLSDVTWRVGSIVREGVTAARIQVHHKPTDSVGVVYGVHWPSGYSRFAVRARAHREATKRLGHHLAYGMRTYPRWWRLVAGDTNLDHHRRRVRHMMEAELGLRDIWSAEPTRAGSHGSRLIDAMFTYRLHTHDAGVFRPTAASDHRAIWADFTLP